MLEKNLKDCFKKSSSTILKRFWKKVKRTSTCWLWNAATCGGGYGIFWAGVRIYAHRFSYFIANGKLARKLLVCHKCDNPPCVNPSHLFQTDHIGNLNDCRAKGRHAFGSRHGSKTHPDKFLGGTNLVVKLTPSKVLKIRRLYSSGKFSQYELGKRFGVHKRYIWLIVHRKTWRHI